MATSKVATNGVIQFNLIQYFIFPIIKHKEYNIHVMSCAPVKGGIQLHSQLFLWVFYNEVGFQKSRAYLVGLPL